MCPLHYVPAAASLALCQCSLYSLSSVRCCFACAMSVLSQCRDNAPQSGWRLLCTLNSLTPYMVTLLRVWYGREGAPTGATPKEGRSVTKQHSFTISHSFTKHHSFTIRDSFTKHTWLIPEFTPFLSFFIILHDAWELHRFTLQEDCIVWTTRHLLCTLCVGTSFGVATLCILEINFESIYGHIFFT